MAETSLTASLLNIVNANSALSALFANQASFGDPLALAANAQRVLDYNNQFPSDQALALSGLFTRLSALNTATAPLAMSLQANPLLAAVESPVLPSAYTQRTATSSNSSAVTASVRAGATVTSYQVGVNQLAVPQVDTSNSFASATGQAAGVNINAGANTVGVTINGVQATADYFINGGITNQQALTALAEAISSIAGNNDLQRITIDGAGSGNFALTFNGQTTAALAFNASAATVQAALEALPGVGAGQVSVSQNATNSYTIAFKGTLANRPLPKLLATNMSLGSSASISVETLGPTATVVTSGANSSIQVAAGAAGTGNAFTLADVGSGSNGVAQAFGATPVGTSGAGVTTDAQDAVYSLNGAIYRATNGNSATIDGGNLTLSFAATTSSPATIAVASDASALPDAVSSLVTAYNDLQTFLSENKSLLTPRLAEEARNIVATHGVALANVGITSDTKLSVDEDRLDAASAGAIETAFGGLGGIATQLNELTQTVLTGLAGVLAAAPQPPDSNSSLATQLAAQFAGILFAGQDLGHNLSVSA